MNTVLMFLLIAALAFVVLYVAARAVYGPTPGERRELNRIYRELKRYRRDLRRAAKEDA